MYTSSIKRIKKRSGEIVEFHPGKILIAMSKAFAAVKGVADQELANVLTQEAVKGLEENFQEKIPAVEDVQNMVEQVLMKA
jgi:ribonucleoside-triphosphate reductase